MQTRVNATKLQRQDTVKIREKRKQKEHAEAAAAPPEEAAIREAEENGDGPLVLPDFTPLTNGNRYVTPQQYPKLHSSIHAGEAASAPYSFSRTPVPGAQ